MQKRLKKLTLNRETLRQLSGPALRTATGARTTPYVSMVYTACPLDCETAQCPIYTVVVSVCINGVPQTCGERACEWA